MSDRSKDFFTFTSMKDRIPEATARLNQSIQDRLHASITTAWSPTMQQHIEEARATEERYFHQFGITSIAERPVLQTNNFDQDRGLAATGFGHIAIPILSSLEWSSAKDFMQMRYVLHELYHGAATFYMKIIPDETHGIAPKFERLGLAYRHLSSAVEEGLADLAISNNRTLLEKQFPEESAEWSSLVHEMIQTSEFSDDVREWHAAHPEQVETSFITFTDETGQQLIAFDPEKLMAQQLVTYLSESIPDFIGLAERARMQDQTITYAHALRVRFGPLWKKIMSIPRRLDQMEALLTELKAYPNSDPQNYILEGSAKPTR